MPARFPVRIRQTVLAFPAQALGLCPCHQHRYHCWLPACNCTGKSAAPTAHLVKNCGTRLSKLPKLLRPKMKRSRTVKPLGPSRCFLQEWEPAPVSDKSWSKLLRTGQFYSCPSLHCNGSESRFRDEREHTLCWWSTPKMALQGFIALWGSLRPVMSKSCILMLLEEHVGDKQDLPKPGATWTFHKTQQEVLDGILHLAGRELEDCCKLSLNQTKLRVFCRAARTWHSST